MCDEVIPYETTSFLHTALSLWLCGLLGGCGRDDPNDRLQTVTIPSAVLGKDMVSQVYLPEDYDAIKSYPVLYFLPGNGGSSYTVIQQFGITQAADELTADGEIAPLIIVALGIDNSFGLNCGAETREVTRALNTEGYDVRLHEGRYEDYILQEAIPYIDAHFSTDATRDGRYIGGYSMGGFAALHLAFAHPALFSKVGGHSPSLFVDISAYAADSWLRWLYPNEEVRAERDPILLAASRDLGGLTVFLDTGAADPNVEGCQKLYEVLTANGVPAEFHLFDGTHGFAYCSRYMQEYLLFYAASAS